MSITIESGDLNGIPDTLTKAFMQRLARTPDAVAVSDERRSLSYRELNALANTIAAKFPQRPQFVGVVMDHGVEMIATLLAILKVGAAYVPAEPAFPQERIQYMMSQSESSFVITQQQYAQIFNNEELVFVEKGQAIEADAPDPCDEVVPESLAYVLYTSGTTGYPKGVAVEHRNVCHYLRAFSHEFSPTAEDVMLQNSVCTFDIFVEEVFPVLMAGGRLAIPDQFTRSDMSLLMDFIDEQQVTIVSGFPYLFAEFNKADRLPETLRLLISGGDVLKAGYISQLIDKVDIYNTYGPTETTVCATYFKCNGSEPLEDTTYPIGKPVLGTEVRLVDEHMQPVKEGEIGEICILGGGVSRGYLNDSKHNKAFGQTEEGERFYRSGDLGRMLPDGNIDFLRRSDDQVMILGKRVEPQEVELVLERNPYVEHAVVRPGVDEAGYTYLTAYIVPSSKDINVTKLRSFLSEHVPEFMVPEFFVALREMPLTTNGKVDFRSLPVVMKGA